MISSDILRGYNDTIILHLLFQKDSYGYEISKQIENQSDGSYRMKETTLYSTFARLQKKGYISCYPGDQTNGRPRTYYHITPSGRNYYQQKCMEWEETKELIERFTQTHERNDNHG